MSVLNDLVSLGRGVVKDLRRGRKSGGLGSGAYGEGRGQLANRRRDAIDSAVDEMIRGRQREGQTTDSNNY